MKTLLPALVGVMLLAQVAAQQLQPVGERTGLVPLTEMGGRQYKGQDGGLYGHGRNDPPTAHLNAALSEANRIVPLDADGKAGTDGRIVLLSLGMSNTTMEFSTFVKLVPPSGRLVAVDGAQNGQDAAAWDSPDAQPWVEAERRLRAASVTPNQVQAVWIKQALIMPAQIGEFPRHADKLRDELGKVVRIAKSRYPNLRLAYLSSRVYGGYATTPLNPEPYAYESAFSVRGLILNQINGSADLNFDPKKGEVKAPLLLWGPYLWADGMNPRASDHLIWDSTDLRSDGTHPTESGRAKVAQLLLAFFKSDPTSKLWFQ